VVALVANPLILSMIMKRSRKDGRIIRPEDDLRQLKRLYVRGVTWALNHRFLLIVMIFVCMGGALGLVALGLVKVEMFPDADFDYIYITVETPRGTEVALTDAVAKQVEAIVEEHVPEASRWFPRSARRAERLRIFFRRRNHQ
jgi:multidrug efflux pump subunit AcrB